MLVTALKQQIKNPERVSVFVDGKYTFSLTLSQVVAEKLRVGFELDSDTLQEFKEKSTNEKLRLRAMNWVMTRPHSMRELSQYLRRATYKSEHIQSKLSSSEKNVTYAYAVDEIVQEFARRGWVDDAVFAKWWVERNSRVNRSKSYLRSELMQKGVSREIIDDVLLEKDETEILQELVRKCRTKTKYQDEKRLFRYLMSKGFGYSSVADALKLGADDRAD